MAATYQENINEQFKLAPLKNLNQILNLKKNEL